MAYLKKIQTHISGYSIYFLLPYSSLLLAQTQSDYNSVDATITIHQDRKLVDISQTNEWKNHSPDALSELYFYDWNNAYSSKTSKLAEEFISDFKKSFHLSSKERKGYTFINSIIVENDTVLPVYTDADIFKIRLPKPLKSGETIKIDFNYKLKLPDSKFTNYGYSSNRIQLSNFLLLNCDYMADKKVSPAMQITI